MLDEKIQRCLDFARHDKRARSRGFEPSAGRPFFIGRWALAAFNQAPALLKTTPSRNLARAQ